MNETINIVGLRQPGEIDDPLTDVLRTGARQLLARAVELEAEVFLSSMQHLKLADGRDRLVRHGHGPERSIQTGIGPVSVSRVKVRDRGAGADAPRIRFASSIVPLWARRTKSLDALLRRRGWRLQPLLRGGFPAPWGHSLRRPLRTRRLLPTL